jgi:hypothetical protein
MLERWRQRLEAAVETQGHLVADAILPCFQKWIGKGRRVVSFRVTQVLSGHGCFGEYLCNIGKERTSRCHHCAADRDSALHTLAYCPAWVEERRVLIAMVRGGILSPGSLVKLLLDGEEKRKAASSFCETVMSQKEEAERIRRGEVLPPDHRRNPGAARMGRRLRAHLRAQPV